MVVIVAVIIGIALLIYMIQGKNSAASTKNGGIPSDTNIPETTEVASDAAFQRELEQAIAAGYEESGHSEYLKTTIPASEAHAISSLTLALEAQRTGDYSKLLSGAEALGYQQWIKDASPETVARDIQKVAEGTLRANIAKKALTDAMTSKSTSNPISRVTVESAGSYMMEHNGIVYTKIAGVYQKVGVIA